VSAVFAANDPMAIGAMRAIQGAGLRIPDDIALAGFDNIVWSSNTTPPLTTVNIHKEEIGLLAARRLLDLLHASAPLIPIEIRVRNELVVRQSCCRSAVTHAATETSDYQPGFRD
jgi:DNA-binding LacI/PurR family transcriptional regulator